MVFVMFGGRVGARPLSSGGFFASAKIQELSVADL